MHTLGLRLCEAEGGNMRNAIPREAHALVLIPAGNEKRLSDLVSEYAQVVSKELAGTEPDLKIECTGAPMPGRVMKMELQKRLIASVYSCPNGTIRMSDGIPGLVETSTNLAIVRTEEEKILIHCLLRSSVDSAKENLAETLRAFFEMAGAAIGFTGSYPGWKPNIHSPIMKTMERVYKDKYNKEPEIKAVHAGLECGIIGGVYPNLDMISFGPTIRHPHSPDEKVHIESVQKFWDFLQATLQNAPNKE
jgi:dipeptidase D